MKSKETSHAGCLHTHPSKWIIYTIKQTNIMPVTPYLMLKRHHRPNDSYSTDYSTRIHSFISAGLCSDRQSQVKPPRPFPPGPAQHRWLEGFFLSNLFFSILSLFSSSYFICKTSVNEYAELDKSA